MTATERSKELRRWLTTADGLAKIMKLFREIEKSWQGPVRMVGVHPELMAYEIMSKEFPGMTRGEREAELKLLAQSGDGKQVIANLYRTTRGVGAGTDTPEMMGMPITSMIPAVLDHKWPGDRFPSSFDVMF